MTRARTLLTTVALAALVATLGLPAGAAEIIDARYTLDAGGAIVHDGEAVPGGTNPLYFDQGGVGGDEACSKDATTYCETILLTLNNPVADLNPAVVETASRTLSVTLNTQAADYDLLLYKSDANGTKGTELARSTAFPTGGFSEFTSGAIRTTDADPTAYALVQVVYFAPATPMTLDIRF